MSKSLSFLYLMASYLVRRKMRGRLLRKAAASMRAGGPALDRADFMGPEIGSELADLARIRFFTKLRALDRFDLDDSSGGFLDFVAKHWKHSEAQLLQDVWALYEANGKRNGFFVEFGATNGRDINNTYMLEKYFGWDGILSEPNPVWHEALKLNRSCKIDTRCVWSKPDEEIAFSFGDDPELGGVTASLGDDDRKRRRLREIKVPTITLEQLLEQHDAPDEIDFLSIDTEGSELSILSAFPWDETRFKFSSFAIEFNDNPERLAALDALLGSKGYKRVLPHLSRFDAWYVLE